MIVISIGQVHRARLHGGKEVVIKIQSPGIEKKFRADMATTISFCELAMPQHVPPMKVIRYNSNTRFALIVYICGVLS